MEKLIREIWWKVSSMLWTKSSGQSCWRRMPKKVMRDSPYFIFAQGSARRNGMPSWKDFGVHANLMWQPWHFEFMKEGVIRILKWVVQWTYAFRRTSWRWCRGRCFAGPAGPSCPASWRVRSLISSRHCRLERETSFRRWFPGRLGRRSPANDSYTLW